MSDSPLPRRGVFLSYAREDADPARRIADALRGFGIEVWFDQSELRGGDAWDAKIKRQIRECALFVALVSAHSQARGEGYFRREWKLAIERTHDMAAGIPFLLPVVIDGTPESQALVPEEFMRVQWTRLAGGTPTPQFVERINRLLDSPSAPAAESVGSRAAPAAAAGARRKPGIPSWAWGIAGGAVLAAAAVVILTRKAPPPPAPAAAPVAEAPAKLVDEKSIAVLPFANMSDDKENAFFTDGMQEDILTNLALVRELRVVSRTSVLQYRDTTKSIRQIASELGVAYILEGSVRRAGNKVRVTGQLIHAASDEHVWAKAYDRDLTDIFAIQSELSQAIAAELKAALSPEEKALLDRKPTENAEAYDLYLQARGLERVTEDKRKLSLLEKATTLDPGFAWAWGDLADSYAYNAFTFRENLEESRARAKAAIDRALSIAPEDPEVVESLGTYYYYGFRDYGRANEIYQKLLAQRPNDAGAYNSLGLIQRRQGHWAEALANFHRAAGLDVASPVYLGNLISGLAEARRYDELAAAWRKMAALRPTDLSYGFNAALQSFYATGSRGEAEAYLAHLTPEEAASPEGLSLRARWADDSGDLAELNRIHRLLPYNPQSALKPWEEDIIDARDFLQAGERAEALQRLGRSMEEIQTWLAREPRNPRVLFFRGVVEMIQGNPAAAKQDLVQSVALVPVSLDAVDGGVYAALAAFELDYLGEKEMALAEYRRLLPYPGAADILNVYSMKADPRSTLRGDPRYQALLEDPKNNAPRF